MRRSDMDAGLQELYDRIPAMTGCDGRCWSSCGPVPMSDRERQRIHQQTGIRITPEDQINNQMPEHWCEALAADHRCRAYVLRPLLCRLWGAVAHMPCVYGCQPEGGPLPDEEGVKLIRDAYRIGGGNDQMAALSDAEIIALVRSQAMRTSIARGHAGDAQRAHNSVPAAFRPRMPRTGIAEVEFDPLTRKLRGVRKQQ